MAIICLGCFPKRSANSFFLRLLRKSYCEKKLIQSSVAKSSTDIKDAPVKFTTNKASTVTIAETTGLRRRDISRRITAQIIFLSLAVFLIYFCVLREENDFDEILKGNIEPSNDKVRLINLKLKLNYCEKNNLPTGIIKAKIKELEEKEALFNSFIK